MDVIEYGLKLDEDRKVKLEELNIHKSSYKNGTMLNTPSKIVALMKEIYDVSNLAEEYVWILAMNTKNMPIGIFEVSHGGIDRSVISPKEVFIRLCMCGARSFVLIHNHPSDDYNVTLRMNRCGDMMEIHLLDHIIIGEDSSWSFGDNTDIWNNTERIGKGED